MTDCLIQLGFLYLQQNDPGRAMLVLAEAQERIPSLFVNLLAKVALGQAMCLAAAGLGELAREVTAESLRLRKCVKPQKERVTMEWLECRIAVHLGDFEEAIPRLEAIRRWFLGGKDLGRLCLCSLDLAYAYALAGRLPEQLPEILCDIAQQPGAGEEVWALGALWRFREAVIDQARDPAAAVREAAALIYRRERSLTGLALGRLESPPPAVLPPGASNAR